MAVAADDVVAVTEEVVIAAINQGTLTAGEAHLDGPQPVLRWRWRGRLRARMAAGK